MPNEQSGPVTLATLSHIWRAAQMPMQVPFQRAVAGLVRQAEQGGAGMLAGYLQKQVQVCESLRTCIVPYRKKGNCAVCNSIAEASKNHNILFFMNKNNVLYII